MKEVNFLVCILSLCIVCTTSGIFAYPIEDESADESDSKGKDGVFSLNILLVSSALLCSLVLIVAGCSWAWWRRHLCCKKDTTLEARMRDGIWAIDNAAEDTITIPALPGPRSFMETNVDIPIFQVQTGDGRVDIPPAEIYADDWFIPPHNRNFPRMKLEYVSVLGKGWFGELIEAEAEGLRREPQEEKVIVKQMQSDASRQEEMRFLHEVRVFRDADHGNILQLLAHNIEQSPYLLVFQKWPLGDLKSYLKANLANAESMSDRGVITRMALGIAHGLDWMINNNYVHGDLAARNCLVTNADGSIVIGDYGMSPQKFPHDYYWYGKIAIPIRWAAPESIRCSAHNFLQSVQLTKYANIWSFGVVLWELLEFGDLPYSDMSNEDVLDQVITAKRYIMPPPVSHWTDARVRARMYRIMTSCWTSSPEQRPPMSSIIQVLSQPSTGCTILISTDFE